MKTKTLFLLFYTLFSLNLIGQCPDYFIVKNQIDIDSFPILYPNCDSIEGKVEFDAIPEVGLPGKITDLSPMYQLRYIGGSLEILYTDVKEIEFPNLEFIGEYLDIIGNDSLENITSLGNSLNNKVSVGIWIGKNSRLETVELDIGSSKTASLYIVDNDSLSFVSLPNIDSLTDLHIKRNPQLTEINFTQLKYIFENLILEENSSLENIDWTKDISFIGEGLKLFSNNSISNVDFGNATGFTSSIIIKMNALLNAVSFKNNEIFPYSISIKDNPSLIELTGLNGIKKLEWLEFSNNESLKSLPNMPSLDTIAGVCWVLNNQVLEDISGITSSKHYGNLFSIIDNPSLAICSYATICDYLIIKQNAKVENNAPGCEHKYEVLEGCGVSVDDDLEHEIKVFPMPFIDKVHIEFGTDDVWEIMVLSMQGDIIKTETFSGSKSSLDLNHIPEGPYVIRCSSSSGIFTRKIMKL